MVDKNEVDTQRIIDEEFDQFLQQDEFEETERIRNLTKTDSVS